VKSVDPKNLILKLGFPRDRAELIHSFIGGSALHGIKLPGTDDTDVYGVYVEKPWLALGIEELDHFVASTAPQDRRNISRDTDVTCYSLRKWAILATQGNPTILHFVFTPPRPGESAWARTVKQRRIFLARSHAKKYAGYAVSQLKRLHGSGKHGARPEYSGEAGYDTKAAMHALRLLYEGIELMQEQQVTLPRPAKERKLLLGVRRGEWPEEQVHEHGARLLELLETTAKSSPLPDCVDRKQISELVGEIYLAKWGKRLRALCDE
jgi:uncharacterized protein